MMSVFNSDLTLNYKNMFKVEALHYCLKNGKFDQNSDKSSLRTISI